MFGTSKNILSKQMKGKVVNSDFMRVSGDESGMAMVEQDDEFRITRDFMTDAYRVCPWIRSIVETSKERVDQVEIFPVPLDIKNDTKEAGYSDKSKKKMEDVMNLLMKPNDDYESFSSLKKKMVGDVLVYDEAGIQIRKGTRDDKKIPYELYANVSGEELYVHTDESGKLKTGSSKKNSAFLQIRARKVIEYWDKYSFLNFIKNKRAGFANGFSPIESIAASILGDMEGMNYNMRFYENNARPNIAFIFENLGFGPGKSALERAEAWYNSKHKGQPHKPLFMGSQKGTVKMQELTMSNKDMEFSAWELFLISRIMSVYGMQPMVMGILTDTTGKLNSEAQGEQFKKNTVIPLVKTLINTLNSVLIWGDSNFNYDDIYLTTANLDIDDEKKQADIWEIYMRTGVVTINQIRNRLQMPPVSWGTEPFVPLNFAPLSILREYQLSKIESNLKSAMNPGIDNNVVRDKDKKDKKDSKAKKEDDIEDAEIDYMAKNFKIPSGLEHIEPTLVLDAFRRIVAEKDARPSYFDTNINSIFDVPSRYNLSWQNILKNR